LFRNWLHYTKNPLFATCTHNFPNFDTLTFKVKRFSTLKFNFNVVLHLLGIDVISLNKVICSRKRSALWRHINDIPPKGHCRRI